MSGFSHGPRRSYLVPTRRGLTDTALPLTRLLLDRHVLSGRLRSRGGSRIRWLGDKRGQTRQIREVAVLPVGVLELSFPTSGISAHTLPFRIRQHRLFQMSAAQFEALFPQRSVQGSHQPLLQNPDTAETSLKEIPPALQQTIVIHAQRDLLE